MKKHFYLFVTIVTICQLSFAQNYSTINPDRTVFFEDESSFVSALRIDSIHVSNDTILFPFRLFLPVDEYCFSPNLSSWIGTQIIMKENSENLFFNQHGEAITIKTNASLNESWTFYQSADLTVIAQITDWEIHEFLNVEDSVKTISFQAFDNGSNTIEHAINGYHLHLSKNYGLLSVFNFFLFPETDYHYSFEFLPGFYLSLIGMTDPDLGFQNLTMYNVFDFQPGDELHIAENLNSNQGKKFQRKTILNYLEKESLIDSIVYRVERISFYQNFELDSIYHIHDTIWSTIKPDDNFDRLPGEPDRDAFYQPIWSIKNEGLITKTTYTDNSPFFYDSDDCWGLGHIDFGYYNQYYLNGLGGRYFYDEVDGGPFWTIHTKALVYYKKNGVTWGNPLIITNVHDKTMNDKFLVYPNPAKDHIRIASESSQPIRVEILDLKGNIVIKKLSFVNEMIDISSLNNGVYLIRITDDRRNLFIEKIVKQ